MIHLLPHGGGHSQDRVDSHRIQHAGLTPGPIPTRALHASGRAAIPRAIAVTTVAVPTLRQPVRLDGGGTVHMIPRDLDRVEAQLEDTELGEGLVTTPRQTMYDLLMRPNQGKLPDAARDAARNFRGHVSGDDLAEICEWYGRANDAVRNALSLLRPTHHPLESLLRRSAERA